MPAKSKVPPAVGAAGLGALRDGSGGSARSAIGEVAVMPGSGDAAGSPGASLPGAGATAGDGAASSSMLISCALGAGRAETRARWDTAGAADVS